MGTHICRLPGAECGLAWEAVCLDLWPGGWRACQPQRVNFGEVISVCRLQLALEAETTDATTNVIYLCSKMHVSRASGAQGLRVDLQTREVTV